MESAKKFEREEGLPEFSFHVNENQVEYIYIELPVLLSRLYLFQLQLP